MKHTRTGVVLAALGLFGWSLFDYFRKTTRLEEKKTRKEAVATWEGEGGGLPNGGPSQTVSPVAPPPEAPAREPSM